MTTYTTPELLLVGAAHNLVLEDCPYTSEDVGFISCFRDDNPNGYDLELTW